MVMLLIIIMRIPSFLEPYAYGDEMIYLTLGQAVRQGIPLYSEIHDNKPPLLYLTAAFSGSLFMFRVVLAIWNLMTVFFFWKLLDHMFPKNIRLQQIATTFFALLTTLPFLEGNIPNSEIFMIGFSILAFYILLKKRLTNLNIFLSGCLFSLAALFKIPAAFDVPVIMFYWLATAKLNFKNLLLITKNSIVLSIGFMFPILITILWYWATGSGKEYLVAAFGQNFGYLSSFRPDDVQESFLVKNGPLLGRGVMTGIGLLILFIFRKKLSKQYLFYSSWLILTIFAITLSERPYPHYLIQSIPPLAALIGMLFTLTTIEQALTILPITAFLIAPLYYDFWHYKSLPYYERFLKYATRQISEEEYRDSFGENVVKDYKIAEYLSSHTSGENKIFVWGDNGSIYALTRMLPPVKFVADYHINDFYSQEQTITDLNTNKPSYIVILESGSPFPLLDQFVEKNYILVKTIDGAQIWKMLSPASFLQNK